MNERRRGAILALLKAASDNLDSIRAVIDADEEEEMREQLGPQEHLLVPPGECKHEHVKTLPSMGGGGSIGICLDCEENVDVGIR